MSLPERLQQFTKPIPVLDHGYLMLVDVMGDDDAIIQAARVSYAKGVGSRKVSDDRQLLRYMLRGHHTSPFEQCVVKLEVKLPIFVERQWVRHRTGRHNEMSARYSQLPNEFYTPAVSDVQRQSTLNKQGRDGDLDDDVVERFRAGLEAGYTRSYEAYEGSLENGVARELSRMHLPVAIYTAKVWQMDLHNLFHFLSLRLDPHAQKEIRSYAEAITKIVKVWVPWAWEAFVDYRLQGMYLTRFDVDALREIIICAKDQGLEIEALKDIAVQGSGLGKGRERKELLSKLDRILSEDKK